MRLTVEVTCPGCGEKLRLVVHARTVDVVPAGDREAQVIVELTTSGTVKHRCRPARRPRRRGPGR